MKGESLYVSFVASGSCVSNVRVHYKRALKMLLSPTSLHKHRVDHATHSHHRTHHARDPSPTKSPWAYTYCHFSFSALRRAMK